MRIFKNPLPLSLYIHFPWCVRKCPYCDFNSHEKKLSLPEEIYIAALLDELNTYLPLIAGRTVMSIFLGGGTPSLFSAESIQSLIDRLKIKIPFADDIEITLEANPGTVDEAHFTGYKEAGINRLSLGIQSLQDAKLKALGRIHNSENASHAITHAKNAGFTNINLDIMYGLPNQTIDEALLDIEKALAFAPAHFSWYQLTLEPNTYFYLNPPPLPSDEIIWEMQQQGQACIASFDLQQYEVSAYSHSQKTCKHNRNYWEFGDYLGIGAGAHSKLTNTETGTVTRYYQVKHPNDYLNPEKRKQITEKTVSDAELIFEFMLNALRLTNGVPYTLFTERTGLAITSLADTLEIAKKRHLLIEDNDLLCPTARGKQFLNNLMMLFLPD